MSWKEKRLITILSIILAVLCAAVAAALLALGRAYRKARARRPGFDERTHRFPVGHRGYSPE